MGLCCVVLSCGKVDVKFVGVVFVVNDIYDGGNDNDDDRNNDDDY